MTTANSLEKNNSQELKKYTINDYKTPLKPIWCAGCGDYGVVNSVYRALNELQLAPENVALISGIGCSSRIPGYVSTYGFNTLHGRAIPIASGLKISSPETTVIVAGGDGDGFAIGGGHMPHVARRNIDMTYIVMDNQIYGLTKGQLSPTSELGLKTTTSMQGSVDTPINIVSLALSYNVSFIAQGFAGDMNTLASLIKQGIEHKGFSLIHVISPCVTYRGMDYFKKAKENCVQIQASHDPTNKVEAFKMAEAVDKHYIGVIYREERPTFNEKLGEISKPFANDKPLTPDTVLSQYIAK
ncbi:MAG: 2-oxoacid:ferredoxin oxidoreductase subunit beta [Candidatus Wallbacteria bacterium]